MPRPLPRALRAMAEEVPPGGQKRFFFQEALAHFWFTPITSCFEAPNLNRCDVASRRAVNSRDVKSCVAAAELSQERCAGERRSVERVREDRGGAPRRRDMPVCV
ncbi:hypothetical protein AAFF_G00093300 [Aldrovandia affinis]|uniref:Uncharacterized protein n=1 Tax=Aldrovandia affinis TaxID=143900 RepID=A0AAD7T2R4_9TELE|nr:hypothetical protein AAFF_G00093300 [Aldrovandia affinis]